jgi:hypothetical protein
VPGLDSGLVDVSPTPLVMSESALLEVTNRGEFAHTLVITDEAGRVAEATDLIRPGESATLQVDVTPGMFQFTCRILAQAEDGSVSDHYEPGHADQSEEQLVVLSSPSVGRMAYCRGGIVVCLCGSRSGTGTCAGEPAHGQPLFAARHAPCRRITPDKRDRRRCLRR